MKIKFSKKELQEIEITKSSTEEIWFARWLAMNYSTKEMNEYNDKWYIEKQRYFQKVVKPKWAKKYKTVETAKTNYQNFIL